MTLVYILLAIGAIASILNLIVMLCLATIFIRTIDKFWDNLDARLARRAGLIDITTSQAPYGRTP